MKSLTELLAAELACNGEGLIDRIDDLARDVNLVFVEQWEKGKPSTFGLIQGDPDEDPSDRVVLWGGDVEDIVNELSGYHLPNPDELSSEQLMDWLMGRAAVAA